MEHKMIKNSFFIEMSDVIQLCTNIDTNSILSDIHSASFDKTNNQYLYPDTSDYNLDAIKLDEFTSKRKDIIQLEDGLPFDTLSAVDAICINDKNEWFLLEFKNSDIKNGKNIKSIKKKMIHSLWYIYYLYSKSGKDVSYVFGNDFSKFARENINFVIVGSQIKNQLLQVNIQSMERVGKHYTPDEFKQFIGYYFKDVYMLTEIELPNFIRKFKA